MAAKRLAPSGLVLRGLRAAVGITQQEHAAAIDIAPGSLSKIETGQRKVPYERLFEMIGILGVGTQAEAQARLAILHGDGLLTESEIACLLMHHGCWPLICLYKSHATFGELLGRCAKCDARITCRPEGHGCPHGCGSGGLPGQREISPHQESYARVPAREPLDPTAVLQCER